MSATVTNPSVAVIGAAGQTGRPLVRCLARRGAKVKAIVHRMDQAAQVPDAAVALAVDLADTKALAAALEDTAVVHYIPPVFNPAEETFGAHVISAAKAAEVSRIIYHSVLHASTPSMPHHQHKAIVELALRESPLAWTILQPAMYSQTPLAFLDADRKQLRVGFDPAKPFSPVDLEDLAEAATNVILESGHEYATYELAGADRLDFFTMAGAIAEALGHTVSVHRLSSAIVASAAAVHYGIRSWPYLKGMLDHYDAHGFLGNPNVLRMLLRREPLGFAEVMKRELGSAGKS
ncbi:MAG TPA: NmrA family NAD(P)-binding protein [Steroidobacter sp.]|uniref:SDR family oxidoreductase n=1 Tax=Steroidobacter sp. TaxID=1978227 RepID=UPI002ED847E9